MSKFVVSALLERYGVDYIESLKVLFYRTSVQYMNDLTK